MSEPKWTQAQRAAIDDRGGALLVSAAAGSGKTAVLTERAVRLITDPVRPADADRILIRSIPEQVIDEKKPLTPIHGNPPSLVNLPSGCAFAPRCPYATELCHTKRPERVELSEGHYAACHYATDPEFAKKNAPATSRTSKDVIATGMDDTMKGGEE